MNISDLEGVLLHPTDTITVVDGDEHAAAPHLFGWHPLADRIHVLILPKGYDMKKFLNILAAIEANTEAILAAKVPVVSTGIGGTITSISLLAEEELSTFMQAFQAMKAANQPAPAPAAPTTTPAA